jgi:hypothetical protein
MKLVSWTGRLFRGVDVVGGREELIGRS